MLAALLSPSSSNNNTSTNGRISQVLPSVKCSTCNQPVPLAELGDHKCEAPPPLPSSNPLSPLSSQGLPVPTLRKPPFTPETATKLLPGRLQGRVAGLNGNSDSSSVSSTSRSTSDQISNSRLRVDVNAAPSTRSGSSISPLQSRTSPLSRGMDSPQSLNGNRNNISNGIGQRTHQRPPLGSSVSVTSSMSSSSSSGTGSVRSGMSGSSSNTSVSSTSPLRARGPGLPSSVSPTHKTSASASMAYGSNRIRTRALSNAGSVASNNSAVSSQPSVSRYGIGSRDRSDATSERDRDLSVSRPEFVPPAERGIDTKSGGDAGMAGVGRRGFTAAINAASTSGYEERERPMGPQQQGGARKGLPTAGSSGGRTVTAAAATSRYADTDAMSVSTSRSAASKSSAPIPPFSGGSNSASGSGPTYSPSKSIPIPSSKTSDNYNSASNNSKDNMPPVGLPSSPKAMRGGGGRSLTQDQGGASLRNRDRSLGASERSRDVERERERERERDRERQLREREREREREAQRLPPPSPMESESEYGGLAYANSTDYEDDDPPPLPPKASASTNARGAAPPSSATELTKRLGHNVQSGSISLRSRSNDRPGDAFGGMSGSVSGSALDRASEKEKDRTLAKRSQSQAPVRGAGGGRRGHARDESVSSAYSSDDDGRGGGRYGSSASVNDGKARDRDRGRGLGDERDRRGRDAATKAIDTPARKPSTKKPKKCLKCSKTIEDGKWVPVDSGGVLCDKCWKAMYLPKCRRCKLPIETQAVSSSDGQLKGKYHKECFNCHTCHEPFPDRSFYVFDGRPYCAYHYHEANDSLCASSRCGQPIEGPCAVSHTGDRYHPEHMTCEYVRPRELGGGRCKSPLDAEYWEVDGKMLCEKHAIIAYGISGSSDRGDGSRRGGSEDGWREDEEQRQRERERERERKRKEMRNMKRVTKFIDLKGGGGLR